MPVQIETVVPEQISALFPNETNSERLLEKQFAASLYTDLTNALNKAVTILEANSGRDVQLTKRNFVIYRKIIALILQLEEFLSRQDGPDQAQIAVLFNQTRSVLNASDKRDQVARLEKEFKHRKAIRQNENQGFGYGNPNGWQKLGVKAY